MAQPEGAGVVEVVGPEPPCPEVRSALAGAGVRRVPLTLEVTEAPILVTPTAVGAAAVGAITEVGVVALLPLKPPALAAVVVDRAWSQVEIRRKPKG